MRGRSCSAGLNNGGHQQRQLQLKGRSLESMVLDRLAVPRPVHEFGQFEELSKLYAIEQPFMPRTQIELQFDVYDGRKLRQSSLMEDANDDMESGAGGGGEDIGRSMGRGENRADQTFCERPQRARLEVEPLGHRLRHRKNKMTAINGPRGGGGGGAPTSNGGSRMSWCRMLFNRNNPGSGCCLMSTSDTNQELGLLSCSSSGQTINQWAPATTSASQPPDGRRTSSNEAIQAALAPQPDDDHDEAELKAEALRLVSGALAGARAAHQAGHLVGNGLQLHSGAGGSGGEQQLHVESVGAPQVGGMEALLASEPANLVSVCLLDKRRLPRQAAMLPATNGRRWARASAHLAQLRRKLLNSSALQQRQQIKSSSSPSSAPTNQRLLAKQADAIARKVSRRFWFSLSREPAFKYDDHHDDFDDVHCQSSISGVDKRAARNKLKHELRLDKENTNELVELVKGSLNQLIDAQLLFRNKLTGAQQDPTSGQLLAPFRGAEYDNLLRNNFNLLKIWQNLEETKRLVCFVCEPIKANLADLFWFNRNRVDWPPAQAFEGPAIVGSPSWFACSGAGQPPTDQLFASECHGVQQFLAAANSSQLTTGPGKCLMFVTPLVCLDASQVKRGLIQILEALNFLHVICKLIHRNLNPKNILVASNDNWKLSGLEFAIRFESTTISESASIMAQEVNTPMLRYTTGGPSSVSALRRQRTLHQTKCQEFVRQPKCLLLQPELDYLAPEIWRHSKCSHKSDIFSFALIVGQTYDLCRHKSPISCHLMAHNYETELKKLAERRKRQLSLMVPFEMRTMLMEMLDCEPNLRPSANYILQLFKRPIELCKANEDSLRHLKSSLGYLDTRLCANSGLQQQQQQQSLATTNLACQQQQQQQQSANVVLGDFQTVANSGKGQLFAHNQSESGGAKRAAATKRASYFKRVTSAAAANREARGRQTKNLQLLNLFLKAVDSMGPGGGQARHSLLVAGNDIEQQQQQLFQTNAASATTITTGSFAAVKYQFEQTLETLKQVYKSTQSGAPSHPLDASQAGASCPACPIDSRSLMFIVALHRRLLDQVALMKADLPPVCRLMVAPGQVVLPSDRNYWPSSNHRALADAEDRLHLLVSKQSMARFGEALADPLLKLDEFLLVFELVSELVNFVGLKCRQSFSQRGKQLLNELTPVTGCPSLSSSDEEDEEETSTSGAVGVGGASSGAGHHQLATLAALTSQAGRTNQLVNSISSGGGHGATGNNQIISNGASSTNNINKMSNHHRYSDYDGYDPSFNQLQARQQHQQQHQQQQPLSRPPSRQINLPTSINIVAPSPMGSMRDVSHRTSVDSSHSSQQQISMHFSPSNSSNKLNHQQQNHQRYSISYIGGAAGATSNQNIASQSRQRQLNDDYHGQISNQMAQQLNLNSGSYQQQLSSSSSSLDNNQNQNQNQGQNNAQDQSQANQKHADDKSRSQLIDELLKTINDDSFNDFIDFNNKYTAAKTNSSGGGGGGRSSATGTDQLSAIELANSNRPRSAIDGLRSTSGGQLIGASGGQQQQQQQQRPKTLNLDDNGTNYGNCNNQQANNRTTFDNVIRRMSTNFVQNFNKMSATTLGTNNTTSTGAPITADQQQQDLLLSTNNLRRERSSTSASNAANVNHQTNSLYVDNQIPARRHSDNTINVPRIQVALSSPQASGSRTNLNQRATASASKLANKWKLSAKTNQREASDKLSPNLGGALSYMRRHSSGNTNNGKDSNQQHHHNHNKDEQSHQSNGHHLLPNASPFKTRSSSNLGLDFLLSNRSMKRRYSAASMLGHQTQRKAEDLLDAGMKSVQNMFS